MSDSPIRLLVADVDGTLVTPDKELTDRAVKAVRGLHDAGILFAITSGRPPRGMAMLTAPLQLTTPIAAFNGGVVVDATMTVLEQRTLPVDLVVPLADLMRSHGLDVWVYRGKDWYVPDRDGPHVHREARTVQFEPRITRSQVLDEHPTDDVAKLVGVSDDYQAVSRATDAAHDKFGDQVSLATSQPYYLDVTHPDANKGHVVGYLADRYGLRREQIATIGDMPNDVLMFAHSALSIAMGNADPGVKRAARRSTTTNDDEGFARAVERYILTAR